jgi:hypothetical protein
MISAEMMKGGTLEQSGRQIVSVFDVTLTGMARAHSVAAVIEEAADHQVNNHKAKWTKSEGLLSNPRPCNLKRR